MLSDRDLAALLVTGRIRLDPLPPQEHLQPVSIDVTLGRGFRVFHTSPPVRIGDIPAGLTMLHDVDRWRLRPGEFVLATTAETVTLPDDVAARMDGKSTLGRLGLSVHATAGLIDPGYSGQITLEVSNVGPLTLDLHAGDRIGQLTFEAVSSPCLRPYGSEGLGSHYQGQSGPVGPRSGRGCDAAPSTRRAAARA